MKTVLKGDKTGISKTTKTILGGFFKYHYLEHFEDTIEGIEFNPQLKKILFDFDEIEDPFDYKIKILENDQPKTKKVDLIESFNYLLGLNVEQIITSKNNGRTYIFVTGKVEKRKIVTIWRSIIRLDLKQDKKIIEAHLNDVSYSIGKKKLLLNCILL
ncbi:unnamed protein product [marine sediment metagenome]|uniref:Uncharacterized protein n=1 Tax=marine sediment metagenome TaxID=412755 RepID=X1CFF2_9ZZZZ